MTNSEQRKRTHDFIARWTGRGYEKGESQSFWLDLLALLGVENPTGFIRFEEQVRLDHTSFIDGFIPLTHVLIEQKSLGKDLRSPIKQSDGTLLTPFQQAKRYSAELPYSERPRWIVTCNFAEFLVYDMEQPNGEPSSILLKDLEKELYRLQFLVRTQDAALQREMEISLAAGELVGRLYDALLAQYIDPASEHSLKSLNALCVRLVFCLYAEDAGLFPSHNAFHDYLASFNPDNVRDALIKLFRMLDTKPEERDPYERPDLLAFPYVNGGLFRDESIEIPRFTPEILHLLLKDCSADFDWSGISPTIFGAVFESTLNPETRRSGGMHYTSIENIHKVIDPLFLNDLNESFEKIERIPHPKKRHAALLAFQDRLASLTFLDPACGSGNFLTETFLSLRRLENKVLKLLRGDSRQLAMGGGFSPIKVSISQFYGIEINDFAATVAKTALWIAESQMMRETEDIVGRDLDFLPLKTYTNITEGNALRLDWREVWSGDASSPTSNEDANQGRRGRRPSYIMGNPPFVGFTFMSKEQKEDMHAIFPDVKNLDFVCAWYKKASDFIEGTDIRCAFVSTNSITQGETVARFWDFLNINIDFAYRTFRWDSEAKLKAHVHCVIVGFSSRSGDASSPTNDDNSNQGRRGRRPSYIFDGETKIEAKHINAYLIDAPDIIVRSRNTPLCNIPKMIYGNKPADGGNLILEDADYADYVKREPQGVKFIRPLLGAAEFINGKKRWCFWLVGASPAELRACPLLMKRIHDCQKARLNSVAATIRKFAETPTLFAQRTQPEGVDYLLVPRVSSERRRYIPIGYMSGNVIASDAVQIIPSATLYHFGVLTSNVHMAWTRAVCGRLEMRYRYSKDIVYNNFPWPGYVGGATPSSPSDSDADDMATGRRHSYEESTAVLSPLSEEDGNSRRGDASSPSEGSAAMGGKDNGDGVSPLLNRIEETAQAILDARALYPDSSLADLYDETLMPPELRKAHQANDRAVMAAYGFPVKGFTESDCVAALMRMYQELTNRET